MFVTPAYAQSVGGLPEMVGSVLPFVLIFVIMYFLLIRPQRQQMKRREEMIAAIKRNDSVVTNGGLIGKVTKVIDDNDLEVEIAKDTKVKVRRHMVAEVITKGVAPAK